MMNVQMCAVKEKKNALDSDKVDIKKVKNKDWKERKKKKPFSSKKGKSSSKC